MTHHRIAKFIAASGLCSRREAERWIAEGRVQVDGATIDSPALNVSPDQAILVNGKPLPRNDTARLWKFHKPKGCITSRRDEKSRKTIYDFLPPEMRNLHTVGRLDYNSEGLLLLTNSATLKRHLELPATGLERRYRVRVLNTPMPDTLAQLAKGVTIEGVRYKGITVKVESAKGRNTWLNVTLTEGKNREIRKVFEHFGHPVSRLIRTAYGPFSLGKILPGKTEEIRRKELQTGLPAHLLT